MPAVFMISLYGGMLMLFLGFIRAAINGVAEMYCHDSKSASRKRKNRSIRKHFAITAVLFAIAFMTQFA